MATINFPARGKAPQQAQAPMQRRAPANDPVAKLCRIRDWANDQVVGRTELVNSFVLAVAAGTNCTFIGPPGTAKTMAVRLVASAFCDKPGDVFDILLTKFTKAFEVFGPTDIAALEAGEVRTLTDGFMPTARVVVVDEVFKGSSAILNSLLTLANEHRFKNGRDWEECPVRTMVGMSNEFPEEPSILAAFFDRFPVKLMVGYLDNDDFALMLQAGGGTPQPPKTLSQDDFAEIDRRVQAAGVNADVYRALTEIRANLKAKNVVVSDRRWKQALQLLKASAILQGRPSACRADLPVLELVCWNQEADRAEIKSMIPEFLNPFDRELRGVTDEVYAQRNALLKAMNMEDPVDPNRPSPDLVTGTQEASKVVGRIHQIGGKLEVIEDMVETEDDKDLLAKAKKSIEAITKFTMDTVRGKNVAEALAATADIDI